MTILRQHADLGLARNVGRSTRLSLTPLDPLLPAQPLGWHTREIVAEVGLGDRLDDLLARGVVALPAGL